jgi:hypothetical protein
MKYLVAIFALALLLGAGAAWADLAIDDGLIPDLPHPGASDTFVRLTGGGAWDGVYDYDGPNPWINIGGDPGTEDMTVTCDIELYCWEWLSANNVYFHLKGDNYAVQPAVIDGLLKSNNGEYVGIEIPQGKTLLQLVGDKDGWGRDVTKAPGYAPIPVTWELSEDAGATWRQADTIGMGANNTVYAMWWLLAQGQPCDHAFKFRITITPKYHQPDGHYKLDPRVVLDPVI